MPKNVETTNACFAGAHEGHEDGRRILHNFKNLRVLRVCRAAPFVVGHHLALSMVASGILH
jgi:hypothetical protein